MIGVGFRIEASKGGAFVFSGPPGTGKTTVARIIAKNFNKTLVVLNYENFASPYVGVADKNLQTVRHPIALFCGV